jgi:molybdenum cofactor cytidylyltransferase
MGRSKLGIELSCAGFGALGGLGLASALESRLDLVYVVVRKGSDKRWLDPYSQRAKRIGKPCIILEAENAERGMSFSIKSGVNAVLESLEIPHGLVIMLGDQPLVTGEMINRLIDNFYEHMGLDYVASSDGITRQPPVLLANSMFDELMKLEGDAGAKRLLGDSRWRGSDILAGDSKRLLDVDTEEDLQVLNDYCIALR